MYGVTRPRPSNVSEETRVDFTVEAQAAGSTAVLYLVIFTVVNTASEGRGSHCSNLPADDTAVFGYRDVWIPGFAANKSRLAMKYGPVSICSWWQVISGLKMGFSVPIKHGGNC